MNEFIINNGDFSKQYNLGVFESIVCEGLESGGINIYGLLKTDGETRLYIAKNKSCADKKDIKSAGYLMKLIKQLKIDSFELYLNDWDEEKIWDPVKQSAKSRKASLDKLT